MIQLLSWGHSYLQKIVNAQSFATILHDQTITGLLLTKEEEEEVIYLILTQLCHNNFLSKLQFAAYLLTANLFLQTSFNIPKHACLEPCLRRTYFA